MLVVVRDQLLHYLATTNSRTGCSLCWWSWIPSLKRIGGFTKHIFRANQRTFESSTNARIWNHCRWVEEQTRARRCLL